MDSSQIPNIWPKSQEIRAFVAGVFLPSMLCIAVMRIIRLVHIGWSTAFLDNIRMDLGFYGGLGAIVVGLFFATPLRKSLLGASQLVFALFLAIEAAATNFLVTTGNALDYPMIAFALSHLSDTWEVMRSETPDWLLPVFGLAAIVLAALPWFIWRRTISPLRSERRTGARLIGGGAAIALTAFLPALFSDAVASVRTPSAHIVATGLSTLLFNESANVGVVSDYSGAKLVGSPQQRPNIVVLVLESTRASGTTVYNPALQTTPFLAKLARRSVVAERAHAVVPHTSKALVSILCGFEPYLEMPIVEATKGLPGRCLPSLLKDQGYWSLFMQSATGSFESRQQLVARLEFDEFQSLEDFEADGFEPVNYFGVEDRVLIQPMEAWLTKQDPKQPFLLTALTVGPHHNYKLPTANEVVQFSEDEEFNRYLNALKNQDKFVEDVFGLFDRLDLTKNTIFVVLGDHGEGFGEHGRFQHDNVVYEEGLHVPLLVFDGRKPVSKRVSVGVSQLDIVPTIAALSGFALTGADYSGADITTLTTERVIPSHCWFSKNCMSAYLGGLKYIHHFGNQPDEVFDLNEDPQETRNLKDLAAESERLESQLMQWRNTVLARYQQHYGKQDADLMMAEAPPVQNKVDVLFENGVRLVGTNMTWRRNDLAVELVFHTAMAIPKGTATGLYVGDGESKIYGVPDPTKPWVPMAVWPTETYVLRHFVIKDVTLQGDVFLTTSLAGVPVRPTGISDHEGATAVGAVPSHR
jgi:lipoteichoic acid synthase